MLKNLSILLLCLAVAITMIAYPVSNLSGNDVQMFWAMLKISFFIAVLSLIPMHADTKRVIPVMCIAAVAFRWIFKYKIESFSDYSGGEWIFLGAVLVWGLISWYSWYWNRLKLQLFYFIGLILLVVGQVIYNTLL